eukprot:TRINITY_DN3259_c0_g1_i1.p1 TRINITY_DN3259_c0_g1~~TRINITY_DN3259_c0_g1_i1.p1  ORF type:complete len:266 (+),score=65.04 TRINITY_DN3259_c0_g1_i1:62-799(+)
MGPCLYEAVAQWMTATVEKHPTMRIAPPDLTTAREGGWCEWTKAYQSLLQMEVWREVHESLEEGGQVVHSTCRLVPYGNEWCFEDGHSKLFAKDMSGMVISLQREGDTGFPWLGVFVDDSRVVLNKRMKHNYCGDSSNVKESEKNADSGGVCPINVRLKKLVSITSFLRMYQACKPSEEPKFGPQLRGVSAPENRQANSGASGGPAECTETQLNEVQENAVNSWVPPAGAADPPSFMLLQGPPGS